MAKDKVYQEYYELKRLKEREDNEHQLRLQQVQSHLNTLDYKIGETTQLIMMLRADKQENE